MEIGPVSLLMAWRACCSWPGTSQRTQNGAVFNLSADTKQGLRKRSLQGYVAQHKPDMDRAPPQSAEMNWIIIEGVAKKTTSKQREMGVHILPTVHLQSQRHSRDCRLAMLPQGSSS